MLVVAIANELLTGYMLQLIQFLLNVQNRQTALFSATQTKKVCASYLLSHGSRSVNISYAAIDQLFLISVSFSYLICLHCPICYMSLIILFPLNL